MTPTPKLRFVERDMYVGLHEVKTYRILQQWYALHRDGQATPMGEWRDVPIEKEEA